MTILLQPSFFVEQCRTDYHLGRAHGLFCKEADANPPTKAYSLSGELQLSDSGWLLLKVPNSMVRGMFDALSEPGLELPLHNGRLNSHITVMSPEEVKEVGGPDAISERGHHFTYSLGDMKTVKPNGWPDVSMIHYVTVDSPALRQLRKSYGLEPLRNGYDHHITVALRKAGVLHDNDTTKTSMDNYYANGDHLWSCHACNSGFDTADCYNCPECGADCSQSNRPVARNIDERANPAPRVKEAALGGRPSLEDYLQAFVDKLPAGDMAGIEVYVHDGLPKIVIIDIMDWGEEAVGKRIGLYAQKRVGEEHVIYHNESATPTTNRSGKWKKISRTKKDMPQSFKAAAGPNLMIAGMADDLVGLIAARRAANARKHQQAPRPPAPPVSTPVQASADIPVSEPSASGERPQQPLGVPWYQQPLDWLKSINPLRRVNDDSAISVAKTAQHVTPSLLRLAMNRVHPKPTVPQQQAGNYKKGHIYYKGIPISIETAKGQYRRGVGKDGKPWKNLMTANYGYVKRTKSLMDGDAVDVFVGDNLDSEVVFIINQIDPSSGKPDEHKGVLGTVSAEDAKKLYLSHYPSGWKGLGSMESMTVDQFKQWLKDGDTSKPVTEKTVSIVGADPLRRVKDASIAATAPDFYPEKPSTALGTAGDIATVGGLGLSAGSLASGAAADRLHTSLNRAMPPLQSQADSIAALAKKIKRFRWVLPKRVVSGAGGAENAAAKVMSGLNRANRVLPRVVRASPFGYLAGTLGAAGGIVASRLGHNAQRKQHQQDVTAWRQRLINEARRETPSLFDRFNPFRRVKDAKATDPSYEDESAEIRERAKTVGQKPHKFKAAIWTFKNGHPRCHYCGDEERIGGMCSGRA
jgi:hypothetical protein